MALDAPLIAMVVHLNGLPGPAVDWVKPDECRNAMELLAIQPLVMEIDDVGDYEILRIECLWNGVGAK